eukprot:10657861-Alexandrium_andersonii.AAC.1
MAGELPGGQPPRATKGFASARPACEGRGGEPAPLSQNTSTELQFERTQCVHALCLHLLFRQLV